jgi:16S rRNA (uracil1498-N3)-methyltransferase
MTKLYVSIEPVGRMFRLNREYKKRLVKVMRLKTGDELQVVAPGKQWLCRLAEVHPDEVVLKIVDEIRAIHKPVLHMILAQAIPKGDRFEWLIQKATELGVAEIFPLITERSVVRPSHGSDKTQRWNEISEQAAGQSENPFPAVIHPPLSLHDFLKRPVSSGVKLLLEERKEGVDLKTLLSGYDGNRITFIAGPEGGWSEAERDSLVSSGFQMIHLGPRILRAETAGLVLATLLQYELGDFRSAVRAASDSKTS